MTQAFIGHGGDFEIGSGSPVSYMSIGEVTNISRSSSSDAIDATHMQSPDGYREFIAGLADPGEVTVEFNFIPNSPGYQALVAAQQARATVPFRVTYPTGSPATQVLFAGMVTGLDETVPVDDKATGSATIKITGKPQIV